MRTSDRCKEAGTKPAILELDYSEGQKTGFSAPVMLQANWGGARNSKSRCSTSISETQAANLIDAADFARRVGLPLNRFITINWEQLGVNDSEAAEATGRFLKLLRDWLRCNGYESAHIWAREYSPSLGSHVHLLVHLPFDLKLRTVHLRWLRQISGNSYRKGAVKTLPVGFSGTCSASNFLHYDKNLQETVKYLLKGVEIAAADRLGIDRLRPCGKIIGKRVATSQNIGRAARSRYTVPTEPVVERETRCRSVDPANEAHIRGHPTARPIEIGAVGANDSFLIRTVRCRGPPTS